MNFQIAVDCVVISYDPLEGELKLLLIRRINEPYKGSWALPGGFVKKQEAFDRIAKKILFNETGVTDIYLGQLQAYSQTSKAHDNRIISIAYYALIRHNDLLNFMHTGHSSHWVNLTKVPKLPFDHSQKVTDAMLRIREEVKVKPIVFNLLPDKFTLNQLQKFYETLYGIKLDNRNFRRKVKNLAYLDMLQESEKGVARRPGELYSLNRKKYDSYIKNSSVNL